MAAHPKHVQKSQKSQINKSVDKLKEKPKDKPKERPVEKQTQKIDLEKIKKMKPDEGRAFVKQILEQYQKAFNAETHPPKEEFKLVLKAFSILQEFETESIQKFLTLSFSIKTYRKLMLVFLTEEPKKVGFKFKILTLWMNAPEFLIELTTDQLWLFLEILKERQFEPVRFDPLGKKNFEVIMSAHTLQTLLEGNHHQKSLSRIAYITYLLGRAFVLNNKEMHEDMGMALEEYIIIGKRMGYCAQDGSFLTKKILPGEVIYNTVIHPEVYQVSNFLKSLFLLQHANLVVLPKIMNTMESSVSLKEFATELKQYYTHLSKIFIPNLFIILNHPKSRLDFKVIHQLSKFLLEFPIEWFNEIENYVRNIIHYAVINIATLSLAEIFEILKLNEFVEVRYNKFYLGNKEKIAFINAITAHQKELLDDHFSMLLQFRYTQFENQKKHLEPLNDALEKAILKIKQGFTDQHGMHYCETELYSFLSTQLCAAENKYLSFSHVCNLTGKEVDIAYINGNIKIAIHIDGTATHQYLDRIQENRRTLLRNKALQAAGWHNIVQLIPNDIKKIGLKDIKVDLLEKLKFCIELQHLNAIDHQLGRIVIPIVWSYALEDPVGRKSGEKSSKGTSSPVIQFSISKTEPANTSNNKSKVKNGIPSK